MKVCFVVWRGPSSSFSFDAGFRTLNEYKYGLIREIGNREVDVAMAEEMEEEFKKLNPNYEVYYNHADVITEELNE